MIKHIFWDIDETLIHTSTAAPCQEHIKFNIDGDDYFTIVRPCAKSLIDFSRKLVGVENVFILTTSTRPYATQVNDLALFGFNPVNLYTREDLYKHWTPTGWSGGSTLPCDKADVENVLIDNLPPRYNDKKIDFIGIKNIQERYFKVEDYYGVNFPEDSFEEDIKNFLLKIQGYNSIKK